MGIIVIINNKFDEEVRRISPDLFAYEKKECGYYESKKWYQKSK